LVEKFSISVDYFVQDQIEMDELENNATAQDVKDQDLMFFRMQLLLLQYRRRLVSDLLLQVPKRGTLITGHIPGLKEKYSDLLDHLNNEILKTVKLVTDDVVNNPEETEQDVASEIYFDEDLKVK
jgi:flavorubredoxin